MNKSTMKNKKGTEGVELKDLRPKSETLFEQAMDKGRRIGFKDSELLNPRLKFYVFPNADLSALEDGFITNYL